ncbi:pleiotropic drug resistance protein 1 [Quercus suber]|uniref:Pleiotropic drug resistance protein 1 n=1 Tax=Quercus suber TaxID=58331 RepID=A0AAW0J6H2_QUESU
MAEVSRPSMVNRGRRFMVEDKESNDGDGDKDVDIAQVYNMKSSDEEGNVKEEVKEEEEVEERRKQKVGIDLPTIEVRFEHLNVEAEAHVGGRALPTFFNFGVNIVEGFLNSLHILPSKKTHLSILKDVSGIVKPRRMTLLLGPPSSGKTTLLLALAGKLDPDLKLSGRVTYNGHGMNEFVPQRTAAYISQYDLHIGEMTVRETLGFSARCQGVGSRYDMLAELSRREIEANIKPDPDIDIYMKAATTEGQEATVVTDYTLKVLGLDVCADTMVGDEMIRGISGGQRKRVTTGFIVPRTRIPVWWRWYYWACPIAWTLYGLVVSQFGDIEELMTDGNNESVKEFVKSYFGYKHDFLGVVAVVVAGIAVLFAFIFAVSIKVFNFQRR